MKRISTTELAKICGVSQGTVDRALNDRKGINPKTKEKILEVAKKFGYRPNIHARSIAGGKSHLIGVVVFDLRNQYFSDILMAIENYCAAIGYSTVVMFTDKSGEKEIECIRNLYYMSVDGIILCPVNSGEEYENFLVSLDIPVITFGNRLNRIQYVGIDNAEAIRSTIEHVLKNGYQKLIYIKPELNQSNTFAQSERLNAFVCICETEKITYLVSSLEHVEKEIDSHVSCALICPPDIYALKLLPTARKHNAGIIGFDNVRIIDELDLKLDSVAYDIQSTAKIAVDYIVTEKSINDPISYQIIKRGSV